MNRLTSSTQWENISIISMEDDFWGVKSSGCENSHGTEVKFSTSPQNTQKNNSVNNAQNFLQSHFMQKREFFHQIRTIFSTVTT
jgi:hypothetical protein